MRRESGNPQTAAIVALPSREPPARFESWPEDVKDRCRDLWSTLGNRNAGRTEWLLAKETPEHVALPSASTIRRWAHDEDWATWATGEIQRTAGLTLAQLRHTWLQLLQLSQETQLDAMLGKYDDNPGAGAVRVKAAESVQRVVAQAGLLAPIPPEPARTAADTKELSRDEGEALAKRALVRRGKAG